MGNHLLLYTNPQLTDVLRELDDTQPTHIYQLMGPHTIPQVGDLSWIVFQYDRYDVVM